jgi:vacuolar protein sorting-associated protein 13B
MQCSASIKQYQTIVIKNRHNRFNFIKHSRLDLRLNVIENLTNIPITFKSGVIHELRIHIPWTRITSEPVVVTINTLEFVAKLKDIHSTRNSTNTSNTSFSNLNKSTSSNHFSNSESQSLQLQQQVAAPPAGYIQNIIKKILCNICIIVNNVIVKFVEDDMVLSINMKSAECFSVNSLWEKTFVDIGNNLNAQAQTDTPQIDEHHLRKIIQLNDVTICLDRLDSKNSNKISFYQDPLIYRCSIQSRLDFKFSSNLNLTNIDQQLKLIKMNFYCRKFDISITDKQLPIFIRLLELILAIGDGSLILKENHKTSEEIKEEEDEKNLNEVINKLSEKIPQILIDETLDNVDSNEQQNDQGWLSWAWSYVPSVSSIVTASDYSNSVQSEQNGSSSIQTIIGVYFDELNVSFKVSFFF